MSTRTFGMMEKYIKSSNILLILLCSIPTKRKEDEVQFYHQCEFEHKCIREQVRSCVRNFFSSGLL